MASIVQRNNRYNVVYLYDDEATGKRKQKWESFKTMADAKRRKAEIEYRQEIGTMVIHQCKTVDELLKEYVALYGKTTWSMSVYRSNTALIEHYISPIIGSMKLSDVTARVLEKYYMQLLKTPSVHRITQKANSKNVIYVAPPTVRTTQHCLRKPFTAGRVQTVLSHRLKPDPKQKQPIQVWILTFWQRYSVIRKWQRC